MASFAGSEAFCLRLFLGNKRRVFHIAAIRTSVILLSGFGNPHHFRLFIRSFRRIGRLARQLGGVCGFRRRFCRFGGRLGRHSIGLRWLRRRLGRFRRRLGRFRWLCSRNGGRQGYAKEILQIGLGAFQIPRFQAFKQILIFGIFIVRTFRRLIITACAAAQQYDQRQQKNHCLFHGNTFSLFDLPPV